MVESVYNFCLFDKSDDILYGPGQGVLYVMGREIENVVQVCTILISKT